MLKHKEITDKILQCFYDVYNELGSGFLESVYENAMMIALNDVGLQAENQRNIRVFFRGREVGDFKADIVVENKVVIELKVARTIEKIHEAQLLNYLKATNMEVGLLLNFGETPQFKRLIFENKRKNKNRG